MDDVLKGNFKVKKPVSAKTEETSGQKPTLAEELKKRALSSLGGSMVYVERTQLTWDGDEKE